MNSVHSLKMSEKNSLLMYQLEVNHMSMRDIKISYQWGVNHVSMMGKSNHISMGGKSCLKKDKSIMFKRKMFKVCLLRTKIWDKLAFIITLFI